MRVHHRIPTVFSLYMVDVLCCALGCVILMWLCNLQATEDQTREAGAKLKEAADREARTTALLAEAENRAGTTDDRLKQTTLDRDAAYALLEELYGHAETLSAQKDDLQNRLAAQRAAARELEDKLKTSGGRVLALEADLRASERRAEALGSKLGQAETRLKDLQSVADLVPELRADLKSARAKLSAEAIAASALEKEIARRSRELEDLNKTLAGLRDASDTLTKTVSLRDKELAAAQAYRGKWEAAQERVRLLEKEADERRKELALAAVNAETLRLEKKSLLDETTRVKAAAANRFAGIELTGKRVVFLVDMSGSMELVDETTPAPSKWLGVRESVAKLMRSLPELEKFQVILFAEKSSYLFGGGGGWIDYDARTSGDRVFKALSEIKPKGGTNMYAALEAAFRLRGDGLDAIYLLSDGLPNLGEGLTPQQAATLSDVQRGEILGKHIRKTLKADWNRELRGRPRVRVNTIGFFYESPDVGAFLWALARENDGSFVGMSRP